MLPNSNDKNSILGCLEQSEEQLSAKSFEVTLVFQNQNRKLGTYENIGYKRPLFFNRLQRPNQGREIFKKILMYLYHRIYNNIQRLSQ